MFLWFSTQFLCSKHTLTRTAHQHTYTAIRICVAWLAVDMLIVLHFNRHQRRRRRWWWRWCTRGPKKTKPINENVLKCCVYAGVTVLCNELKLIDTAKATTTTIRKQTIHENNNNALVNHHRSKYIHTTRYYIIKWSEMKWNDLCWTCTHLFSLFHLLCSFVRSLCDFSPQCHGFAHMPLEHPTQWRRACLRFQLLCGSAKSISG